MQKITSRMDPLALVEEIDSEQMCIKSKLSKLSVSIKVCISGEGFLSRIFHLYMF